MLYILVLSGFFGFWGDNLSTDSPFLNFGGEDPPPTITGVKSAGSNGLGGWFGSRILLDTPTSFDTICQDPHTISTILFAIKQNYVGSMELPKRTILCQLCVVSERKK